MIDPSRQSWERVASRRLLTHSIRHDGLTRSALLYVPRHVRARMLPLVLVFHGGASGPEIVAKASAMHEIAERVGFVVAYPFGTQGRSGLTWSPGGRDAARMTGDTRFVRALIADLKRCYDIDPARIFAAGFSIGGSLVYELASVLADQIAAAAVVCGTMTLNLRAPSQPVPLIHIHGTQDKRVPLEGGRGPATSAVKEWLPVQDCIDRWREINGCADKPEVVRMGLQGATGYRYSGAGDVELWLVEGGGHYWPGGKRKAESAEEAQADERVFSASETIWKFFAAHPRPRDALAPPARPAIAPEASGT